MASLLAILSGSMAKVEMSYTPNGVAFVTFSLLSETYKGGSGADAKYEKQWIRCMIWGERGEKLYAGGTIGKGTIISVRGTLSLQTFTKRDGGFGAALELKVNDFDLLSNYGKNKFSAGIPVGDIPATDKEIEESTF